MEGQEKAVAVTTTIRVRPEVWRALRAMAERRAEEIGGRPSVSGVISDFAMRERAAGEGPRG